MGGAGTPGPADPSGGPPEGTDAAAGGELRTIGLFGATSIGVGAIVGGGILALAGVAFAAAGPAAILAFILNGVIAYLTVLTFAELSARFPQSGGTYTFAKRVLSVRAAFTLGWIVFFASIVAGVLYALGFAEYAVVGLVEVWPGAPGWLQARSGALLLAAASIGFYTLTLARSPGSGGNWATVGKVAVFAVLIAAGLAVLFGRPMEGVADKLMPFAPTGLGGIFAAMGFSFIAFQGFDLIAAAGGEVKDPGRTIPRAMLLSVTLAMIVYLPLLVIIATVGVPAGQTVTSLAEGSPATLVAVAAQNFLGDVGFWLVVVAALLSMLSALQANLYAASRIAFSMARDSTLPRRLGVLSGRNVPVAALLASAALMLVTMLALPNVAAAGAAAGLIFLTVFTLAHGIGLLARGRASDRPLPFRTPFFPAVPIAGGILCAVLAVFQGVVVPVAGMIVLVWVLLGVGIYLWLFAREARMVDAMAEARDPSLVTMRGRSPLVLAPIANPANAEAMVAVASALAPQRMGRVLLLNVVTRPDADVGRPSLENAQQVLGQSLATALQAGYAPEALTTLAADPWEEIARVARTHDCESLLLGLARVEAEDTRAQVNRLISRVESDVVVLRAPAGWRLERVTDVLVPIAGRGHHETLRARLLGTLARTSDARVTYLRVVPSATTDASLARAERSLHRFANTGREADDFGAYEALVLRSDDPLRAIADRAAASDLMVLGLERVSRQQKAIGEFSRNLVAATPDSCAVVLMSGKG